MLNSSAEGKRYNRLGDHHVARFLKRHLEVASTVARAMNRSGVLAINKERLKTHYDLEPYQDLTRGYVEF